MRNALFGGLHGALFLASLAVLLAVLPGDAGAEDGKKSANKKPTNKKSDGKQTANKKPADKKPAKPAAVDFVRDIRPLFQKNCYSCHGPEEQEGGLRLDVKARALEGGDNGRVLVPGNSRASKLLKAVLGTDKEIGRMPPEGEGAPLTGAQVQLLRAWIDAGAKWPADADQNVASKHWAYQPIQRPALPQVKQAGWVRNPIDAFILARLEKRQLKPAPAAPRATRIRRLYLDLLGLPPTPAQVARFLDDKSPRAYEALVDRVLRSPHYGERWGRHWLDLARYADSDGYEKDRPRPHAWRYRQWVIDALNRDLPFDQFSLQQIAGDLLPGADQEARVATGFHRNTLHNTEGGTDKEEDRVKKTVDRTNTFGAIWLGLTVGCAQCHTHKYDPITQREFYSLYSFFNNIEEQDIPAPLADEQAAHAKRLAAFNAAHAALTAKVAKYRREQLPQAAEAWAKTASVPATVWTPLTPTKLQSAHGAELLKRPDHSILAAGKNQLSDEYTVDAPLPKGRLSSVRLEVLPDKSLVKQGPGRANNGNFVLTTFSAKLHVPGKPPEPLQFSAARADFSQKEWGVALAVNANPEDGWAVSPQIGKRHVAVFQLKAPRDIPADARIAIVLDQQYKGPQPHNIGRFRLSVTGAKDAQLEGTDPALRDALAAAPAQRTPAQRKRIAAEFAKRDPQLSKLQKAVADHAKKKPQPPGTKAQATAERKTPRQARVHIRGDFLNPGDPVPTRGLAVLPPVKPRGKRLDRLDLAIWLRSKENPLTARVTVNRIWQRYWGTGLVATIDDFGSQGEPPSHPLLLDWLASELRDHQWSLKHIHRLIVNSAAYRQSSARRPELVEIDPTNRLLARQTRHRVEGEVVRDLALAVSGLLDPRVGGPSVRPPQPTEYSNLTYANSAKWKVSQGGDRYRRGLYTFFQRTSPYPMLMTFDAPDSNECTAQRSTSNTPLQALTLWNDPVFFECAQALGRRIVREAPGGKKASAADRARFAFQLCLSRTPRPEEVETLLQVYRGQRKLVAKHPEIAKLLVGKQPVAGGPSLEEVSAWVVVGRVLLNTDEFVTRE